MNQLCDNGLWSGYTWVNVGQANQWGSDASTNQALFTSLIGTCAVTAFGCGIYADEASWTTIFGDANWCPSNFNSNLLTYTGTDSANDFTDFVGFGCWPTASGSVPWAKIVNANSSVCGIAVDKVYYPQ